MGFLYFRPSEAYREGARKFADKVQEKKGYPEKIQCPCIRCLNLKYHHYNVVYDHLVYYGIDPTYTTWIFHGEKPTAVGETENAEIPASYKMFRDACFEDDDVDHIDERGYQDFQKLVEEAELPLYSGSTHTKMSATLMLFKAKARHSLSDKAFDDVLKIVHELLPLNNILPDGFYSSKKLFNAFDLGYEKIHACENDCCLFRKDLEHLETCPKCGSSRWKVNARTKLIRKGVPAKVLRYFPIIPRFRRLFKSAEKSEQLTWHYTNKSQDGIMRHPVDSLAWNRIDDKWPSFASDPRNLRLGLSSDGFNPFGDLSSRHSCWPVILVTYNLSPLLCMSKENLILTLLIPGPKQPGNDIDVYLAPLIDDLKELWVNGVSVYDAFTQSTFNLRAILMWTINDFPAYGNLSGYAVKSSKGCPTCGLETCSKWLTNSHKHVFMGHRRFLAYNHPFRVKKSWFDGTEEHGRKPRILTGSEVFEVISTIENDWGKANKKKAKKRKRGDEDEEQIVVEPQSVWKKKSMFFELPYWEVSQCACSLLNLFIEFNIFLFGYFVVIIVAAQFGCHAC